MPRVRTVIKHVTELADSEQQVLGFLTMGGMGRMRKQLRKCVEEEQGWAVIHYNTAGRVDGWTLMFSDKWGEYGNTDPDTLVAYFYVDPTKRRQGIGTALMRHAHTLQPEPFVCPWNDESKGFFNTQPAKQVASFY